MQWRDIQFGDRQVRQFSALCLLLAGLWAFRLAFADTVTRVDWLLAGAVATWSTLGLMFPVVMRPVYFVAILVTFPIGWVVSRLLLAVVFFAIITPIALIFRLTGRDVLARKVDPDCESYWEPVGETPVPHGYLRQF